MQIKDDEVLSNVNPGFVVKYVRFCNFLHVSDFTDFILLL